MMAGDIFDFHKVGGAVASVCVCVHTYTWREARDAAEDPAIQTGHQMMALLPWQ